MPVPLMEAAKKICRQSDWKLTNLELQKMLYLAQRKYFRDHPGQRLVDTDFQAWALGPVSNPLYQRVKGFGSDFVKDVFYGAKDVTRPEDKYLSETYNDLLGKLPSQLVQMTHRQGGAWATYYRRGVTGIVIPDSAIEAEARLFQFP